jgi:hypothetical protein
MKMLSSDMLRRVVWCTFTDVLRVFAASIIRAIALMMEAAEISASTGNRTRVFQPAVATLIEMPWFFRINVT